MQTRNTHYTPPWSRRFIKGRVEEHFRRVSARSRLRSIERWNERVFCSTGSLASWYRCSIKLAQDK